MKNKKQTKVSSREKSYDEAGRKMVKIAQSSPKLNPSGKAKFHYQKNPLLSKPSYVVAEKDMAHAARLRGMENRKSRGTLSSAARKLVK
jgi:hypothetical protein